MKNKRLVQKYVRKNLFWKTVRLVWCRFEIYHNSHNIFLIDKSLKQLAPNVFGFDKITTTNLTTQNKHFDNRLIVFQNVLMTLTAMANSMVVISHVPNLLQCVVILHHTFEK